MPQSFRNAIAMCIMILLTLSGCSSTHHLVKNDIDFANPEKIKVGDEIIITTNNWQKHQLTIEEISTVAIRGDGQTFAIDEIRHIAVEKFSPVKTVSATVLGAVLTYSAIMWIAFSSYSGAL